MKKILAAALALVFAASLAGCEKETEVENDTQDEAVSEMESIATEDSSENFTEELADTVNATITMASGGVIKLELYHDVAPITVENFVKLANEGFYDGLIFHRVIEGFMIQGGDPDGNGTGGPGYTIKGEFSSNGVENNISHERGVISMARRTDPDSAGSQFFIVQADASHLDGDYAAFGRVTEGMDVVDEIASVETDYNDKPLTDQVIESIRIDG